MRTHGPALALRPSDRRVPLADPLTAPIDPTIYAAEISTAATAATMSINRSRTRHRIDRRPAVR